MVLEAWLFSYGQHWGTYENLLEQFLKSRAPDIYKDKSYID